MNIKPKIDKYCLSCGVHFQVQPSLSHRKTCSKKCMGIQQSKRTPFFLNKKHSQESKDRMSKSKKGTKSWNTGLKGWRAGEKHPWIPKGEAHWSYIKDRSLLVQKQERNDPAYKGWRKEVWLRDNFKCKIGNPDCKGRIEAHHILGWKDHPELRYDINNGITLCHAHHPRKRAEEKRLSPFFQELINIKS